MSLPPPHVGFNFVDTLHDDIYPAIDPTKSDLAQPSKAVLVTGAGRGMYVQGKPIFFYFSLSQKPGGSKTCISSS